MTRTKPNPFADQHISKLKADGVDVSPADCVWLYELADAYLNNSEGSFSVKLFGIKVGKHTLNRMSLGARIWFADIASELFDGDENLLNLSVCFALFNSRKPELFKSLLTYDEAKRAVLEWSKTIDLSADEITAAIDMLYPTEETRSCSSCGNKDSDECKLCDQFSRWLERKLPEVEKKMQWGEVLLSICTVYGNTPEWWCWNVSEQECIELATKASIKDSSSENRNAEEQYKKRNQQKLFNRFLEAVKMIRREHGRRT